MRDRPGTELSGPALWRRWVALGCYVVAIYAVLPYGPQLGLGVLRTAPGRWLLGPGLLVVLAVAVAPLVAHLRRRQAGWWAYAALVVVALVATVTTARLRGARLERTHLPEYGIAALLAWRALAPLVPGRLAGYLAAAALAGAIGFGDELLQSIVPGRHYDNRDVALNVLGAVLGVVVLAAARAGGDPPASQSGRPGIDLDTPASSPPRSRVDVSGM